MVDIGVLKGAKEGCLPDNNRMTMFTFLRGVRNDVY